MTLHLRRAARADAELLFTWRNDPLTRQMSRGAEPVAWNDHLAWLERLLVDHDRLQLVAEHGGVPVGAIRFDRDGRQATVSLVVAPAARGRGLAAPLITAGIAEAQATWASVTVLRAVIRPDNAPSRRAFARAGFVRLERAAGEIETWRRAISPGSDTLVLDGPRPLVIAELSANHGGSRARAVETIEAAAEAGADAIKLQTYTPETMTLRSPRPEFRVEHGPWAGRTLWELYEEAHTPWDWHADL